MVHKSHISHRANKNRKPVDDVSTGFFVAGAVRFELCISFPISFIKHDKQRKIREDTAR